MQKPYRGDYVGDVDKWERYLKNQRVSVSWGGWLFCCALIPAIVYDYTSPSDVFFSSFFIFGFFTICWCICWKILLHISLIFWGIDYEANRLAENEAEKRYEEDMRKYNHILSSQDEEYDRQTAREIKRRRSLGQLSNEIALAQYQQLAAIQNSHNQQLLQFIQSATLALQNNNASALESSLNALERELGL